MSISDRIVVMKDGIVQQIGRPQRVYDDPVNLFVAKFLGTPPISVFEGDVMNGKLWIGDDTVMDVPALEDCRVYVGIRPEGFLPDENGPLHCTLKGVEVMGRDISIVSTNEAALTPVLRAIVSADTRIDTAAPTVAFSLKRNKVFLFDRETEQRIPFDTP